MICLTALIAMVGGLQWHTMQGQLDQMIGGSAQTDRLIQESTKQSKAAELAADAVKSAADTATESLYLPRVANTTT